MITLKQTCGLGNRLRVIFSFYEYANSVNSKVNVIWIINTKCTGHFLDYWESINNINFISDKDNNFKIDYSGCYEKKNIKPNYKSLKLLPYIEEIIRDKINILEKNYIAVHIRRTDHIKFSEKMNAYTSDDEFIDFIDKFKHKKNLYIATDNKETYDKFKNLYPNLVKFEYHNTINGLRQTSLLDSIIDLYMCVYSDNFKGSGMSSFSQLINNLRIINN